MPRVLPAVQGLGTAGNIFRAAAEVGAVCGGGSFLHRRRHGDDFKGGTRLVAVGDAAVSPLLQPRFHGSVVVTADGVVVSLGAFRFQHIRFFQLVELPQGNGVCDFQIIVGVIVAKGRHTQNFPGIHVHDNPKRPAGHVVSLNGGLQILFQIILHRGVQGQNHAVALCGFVVFFIGIGHLGLIVALGGNDLARRAFQIAVIECFNALRAGVAGVGKANDLTGQGAVGIVPLGVWLQMNAFNVILFNKRPHLIGFLRATLGGNELIAHFNIRRLLFDVVRIHIQNVGQGCGNQINVRAAAL